MSYQGKGDKTFGGWFQNDKSETEPWTTPFLFALYHLPYLIYYNYYTIIYYNYINKIRYKYII